MTELVERLQRRLAAPEREALARARAWCDARSVPLYLVGGSVRDLLLDRAFFDVDLAVDADAGALAREIGDALRAPVTVHEGFGTASVAGDGWQVDVSRARSERYRYPGALPVVTPASIETDLGRRDFTVHAMALELGGRHSGRLLDPFGGAEDIKRRLLRVLHDESFKDDATRILRLARYAARLEFAIEAGTIALALTGAAYLAAISPARLAHELERTFAEQRPEDALGLLDNLHALRALAPALRMTDAVRQSFERLRTDGGPPPQPAEYLAALTGGAERVVAEQLLDRIELRQAEIAAVRAAPVVAQTLRRPEFDRPAADPVAAVEALDGFPEAAVRGAGAALGGRPWQVALQYLRAWRKVRPALRGDDVIALGVPRGPAVGVVLRELRNGRLRGVIRSRPDEERFVRSWLAGDESGEKR